MIFAFADFELDPARFELRRAGSRVTVQPKVLRLLLHLVSHRERAIGEDELMRALWPNEKVSRASIKRAVLGARTALDDHSQTAIRTVRGLGYQFAYDVREARPARTLLGREVLLAELARDGASAAAGRGQLRLLFGAPGLGKTTLLHELATRAGMDVWWGRCLELEGAPAFWPWQQVLRAIGDAELASLWDPDLAEGFPELSARFAAPLPPSPTIGSRQARFRLFAALASCLQRATRERPALILLDDLHSADEPTLRFLRFLAAQLDGSRLWIVAAARPHERLAELMPVARCTALSGFSEDEVADYLRQRDVEPARELVLHLHEQTGGNPLFLEEMLRGGLDAGVVLGLRGAIERHLSMLSAEARGLIAIASVLGREFSLSMLLPLCEVGEAALGLLAQATRAEVLQRRGERYRFQHSSIREVLYEQLDPVVRAQLHQRVGALMEAAGAAHGEELELVAMAEHFRLAVPVGDREQALRYVKLASERAARRHAYEEAAATLAKALELLEGTDSPERVALLLACGEAQALGGAPEQARATLLRAAALARGTEHFVSIARVLGRARETGTFDAARVAILREALAQLDANDARAPGLQAMLAKSLSFSDARAERGRLATDALPRCTGAEALLACHEALTEPEARAQRVLIVSTLRKLAHDEPRVQLAAAITQFQGCLERGELAAMRGVVAELTVLARRVRDPFVRWYEHAYRATCAVLEGSFAEAEQSAQAALQLGKLVGEELSYHFYCVQVNGMMRMQGRLAEAEEMAREMANRFPTLVGWRAWLGSIHADLGRVDEARGALAQLIELPIRDPYLLSALCPLAELCTRVGDEAQVAKLHRALEPYRHDHGTVSFGGASYGPVALQLARTASRLGLHAEALEHAAFALAEAERMHSPPLIVVACLTSAMALHKAGEPGRSFAVRAYELAQATEMRGLLPMLAKLSA